MTKRQGRNFIDLLQNLVSEVDRTEVNNERTLCLLKVGTVEHAPLEKSVTSPKITLFIYALKIWQKCALNFLIKNCGLYRLII
jgi:hypothetical protein